MINQLKENAMTSAISFLTGAAIFAAAFSGQSYAQGAAQTITLVLSVGGFLGVGSSYVVVPYSAIEIRDKKMVLRGATKESLKNLPEYKYAN